MFDEHTLYKYLYEKELEEHMFDEFSEKSRRKIIRGIAIFVAIFSVFSLGGLGWYVYDNYINNEPTSLQPSTEEFPAQEPLTVDDRYPSAHLGLNNFYWEYVLVDDELEYNERQDLLDEGWVALWPEFNPDGLMWFSAHYNGTFAHLGDTIRVGSMIEVTTPHEYEQRHMNDDPDVYEYQIVERLETDIWAEDVFTTTQSRATDMYNDGTEDPWIVIQHSGTEEGQIILYLGELINVVEGEFRSDFGVE